jgi:hypothetical protein
MVRVLRQFRRCFPQVAVTGFVENIAHFQREASGLKPQAYVSNFRKALGRVAEGVDFDAHFVHQ